MSERAFRTIAAILLLLIALLEIPQAVDVSLRLLPSVQWALPSRTPPLAQAEKKEVGRRDLQCIGTRLRRVCVGTDKGVFDLLGAPIRSEDNSEGGETTAFELRGGATACWITRGKRGVISRIECEGPLG